MTSPGHVCAECPDATRIARRCPKPLRDPRLSLPDDAPPSCPVLDVPATFWEFAELGAMIEGGGVSPADVSGLAWQRAIVTRAALRDAAQVAQWQAEQRRKALDALRERTG